MKPLARTYRTVRATVLVPIETEVVVDVSEPERVTLVSAEIAGTLSRDRLMRAVSHQFGTVIHAMEDSR